MRQGVISNNLKGGISLWVHNSDTRSHELCLNLLNIETTSTSFFNPLTNGENTKPLISNPMNYHGLLEVFGTIQNESKPNWLWFRLNNDSFQVLIECSNHHKVTQVFAFTGSLQSGLKGGRPESMLESRTVALWSWGLGNWKILEENFSCWNRLRIYTE